MKYMLLIHGAEDAWTDETRAECMAESTELCEDLAREGKFLGASPLQPIAAASCVRVREGRSIVTDGPFAETREQLAGYFLIDAADLDEAIAIAGRVPGGRVGTVEIRPLLELDGLPVVSDGAAETKV